jgi:hypothetical protein
MALANEANVENRLISPLVAVGAGESSVGELEGGT